MEGSAFMLEQTSHISGSIANIYFACMIFMIILGIINSLYYFSNKSVLSGRLSIMCMCGFVTSYCLFYLSRNQMQQEIIFLGLSFICLSAWMYQSTMGIHLKYESFLLKVFRYVSLSLFVILLVDFINYRTTQHSFLMHPSSGANIFGFKLTWVFVSFVSVTYLFKCYFGFIHTRVVAQQSKVDYSLLVGMITSLLLMANDVLFSLGVEGLVPMACYFYAIEIFRFSIFGQEGSSDRIDYLESELVEASKEVELGNIASQIAHDVRSPLAIISGNSFLIEEVLEDEAIENDRVKKYLNRINDACNRVERIIADYLSLMRREEQGEIQDVDLVKALNIAVQLSSNSLKQHDTTLINEVEPIFVRGYENRLVVSFMNLINNAAQAIEPLDERWVKITSTEDRDRFCIRITDSGHGIPDEIAKKLFVERVTTKEKGIGTGMGLKFVKLAIESCKGEIVLDKSHKHTSFLIYLDKAQSTELKETS